MHSSKSCFLKRENIYFPFLIALATYLIAVIKYPIPKVKCLFLLSLCRSFSPQLAVSKADYHSSRAKQPSGKSAEGSKEAEDISSDFLLPFHLFQVTNHVGSATHTQGGPPHYHTRNYEECISRLIPVSHTQMQPDLQAWGFGGTSRYKPSHSGALLKYLKMTMLLSVLDFLKITSQPQLFSLANDCFLCSLAFTMQHISKGCPKYTKKMRLTFPLCLQLNY